MSPEYISIREWETVYKQGCELSSNTARETAKVLTEKGIVEILELKDGLQISSNSYVGRIMLDNLQINIQPKLSGIPLYTLLRYAYGLRKLKLFDTATHTISELSFFDLLIYELYIEAEDLLMRGFSRSYVMKEESLSSPRGKIDIEKLCRAGGVITERLPCRYFIRSENMILNRIILAGLQLAIGLVVDSGLKVKLRRICSILSETVDSIQLNRTTLQKAKNNLNRLNDRYSAILEIINILCESQGIQLEERTESVSLRGYFFDMNSFFEALIGRLLKDYIASCFVKDQFSLHHMFIYTSGFNPRRRKSPTPRPDFALMQNGKVIKLLDSKYRDLWERNLPQDMLYQLAVYAVSGIGNKTATILYPSMSGVPSIQKIDINDPVSGLIMANVIMQPVNLVKIAELLSTDTKKLEEYVYSLVGVQMT